MARIHFLHYAKEGEQPLEQFVQTSGNNAGSQTKNLAETRNKKPCFNRVHQRIERISWISTTVPTLPSMSMSFGARQPVLPVASCRGSGPTERPLPPGARHARHARHGRQDIKTGQTSVWSIEASPGREFYVCPFLSFQIESCIRIKVESAARMGGFSIKVVGTWQRSDQKVPAAVSLILRKVESRAVTDAKSSYGVPGSSEAWIVQALEGAGDLGRCSKEEWLAVTTDGRPFFSSVLPHVGNEILLQRPRERVYVLRSPEDQLSRLLVDLSRECGEPLLAAPAAHGAVAVMGYRNLVPAAVLSQLQERFSVVFSQSAEIIPVTQATEAILRRLVAFGAKQALCQQGWQTVEFPYRLFHAEALSNLEVLQRPSLRVPCVDIACEKAYASPGKVVAELGLSTAVRLVQPLASFLLRSSKCPELAGQFRLDGSRAILRPPTHVLPRLTSAEITHVWCDGFLPTNQLPPELQSKQAFAEYWKIIHGLHLSASDLSSFARVEFTGQKFDAALVLTYPVSCLWRTPWTEQPALSKQHGQAILKQVFQSLEHHSGYLSHLSFTQIVDPVSQDMSHHPSKSMQAAKNGFQKSSEVEEAEKGGKRPLLLPLVQAVATPNPVSIARQKRRRHDS